MANLLERLGNMFGRRKEEPAVTPEEPAADQAPTTEAPAATDAVAGATAPEPQAAATVTASDSAVGRTDTDTSTAATTVTAPDSTTAPSAADASATGASAAGASAAESGPATDTSTAPTTAARSVADAPSTATTSADAPSTAPVAAAYSAAEAPAAPTSAAAPSAPPVAEAPVTPTSADAPSTASAAAASPAAEAPAEPAKTAEERESERLWSELDAAWAGNDFERVTTILERLRELRPEDSAVIDEKLAAAQYNQAAELERSGDLDRALSLFQEAQRRNPNLGEAAFAIERVQAALRPAATPDESAKVAPAESAPAEQSYTVESGDSLWAIAQRFYGDGNQWGRVYEANRDQLENPDMVRPGQVLRIPR